MQESTLNELINQTSLETRTSARIAAIIIISNQKACNQYLINFLNTVANKNSLVEEVVKATLILGQIGMYTDLSQCDGIIQRIASLF